MDNNENSINSSEQNAKAQPSTSFSDETARYLWNLAQKSNLTVTTAAPVKTPICIKQEENVDPAERMPESHDDANISPKDAGPSKMIWKDQQAIKKEENSDDNPTSRPNPFAALPLSLIKSGILSVTSDSACVKIENGVPILRETTADTAKQLSMEPQTSAATTTITIKPLPAKAQPPNNPMCIPKEKGLPKTGAARQPAGEAKIAEPKIPTATAPIIENPVNVAQFQRRMLFQNQILKALTTKQTRAPPLATNSLVPNSNQMEFAALLGLEIVTGYCLNERKRTKKVTTPEFCMQCDTNFSPRWHCGADSGQKYCERCFIQNRRLKYGAERSKEYRDQVITLEKGLKLPPPPPPLPSPTTKVKPQSPVEPQQLFKSYLQALASSEGYRNDRSTGFSDLTKLGASIAAKPEVYKAMDTLRSLNSTATPESRAKAIQNLQVAFFWGLNEALKTAEMETQQKNSLLCNYQSIVAQLAQKTGLTIGPSVQTTQRRTAVPIEIFERAIKEHKQRLLKTIQNTKN